MLRWVFGLFELLERSFFTRTAWVFVVDVVDPGDCLLDICMRFEGVWGGQFAVNVLLLFCKNLWICSKSAKNNMLYGISEKCCVEPGSFECLSMSKIGVVRQAPHLWAFRALLCASAFRMWLGVSEIFYMSIYICLSFSCMMYILCLIHGQIRHFWQKGANFGLFFCPERLCF